MPRRMPMTAALAIACKATVNLACRLVPADRRVEWTEAWLSDYWHWLHKADAHLSADGRAALLAHTRGAVWAAFSAATGSPENIHRREYATGHPWFPVAALSVALAGLVVWTAGVPETRRLLTPARLPVADRLVLLSQSRPYLGARRGFSTSETEVFAKRAQTLSGIARQQWYTATIGSGSDSIKRPASNVGPGFFDVLGVTPALGRLPEADDEFAASYAYWRSQFGGDSTALGRPITVNGRKVRLVGVLPRDFYFLSPVDIWTAQSFDAPVPSDPRLRRWAGLKGVVARLKPGVLAASAETEIRAIQDARNMGRYTYRVHAAPYASFASRAVNIYGTGFALFLALGIGGVLSAFVRDVRSGSARAPAARYWGLLLAKVILSLTFCFLFVMENTGVNRQGIMGGVWFGRDLFAMWLFLCGSVVLGFWAWRDQRSRCRVCLHRLRDPIRIGIPGQVLLETTGLELMCPKGHGIIYSPESVLGSEMSDHWLGLEEHLSEPAEK